MRLLVPSIGGPIPVLSILDAVGRYTRVNEVKSLGLTGTKSTMASGFYTEGLEGQGLTVITPSPPEQETIHSIIYDELIFGNVNPISVRGFYEIAQSLLGRGRTPFC